jgi:exonuclease I
MQRDLVVSSLATHRAKALQAEMSLSVQAIHMAKVALVAISRYFLAMARRLGAQSQFCPEKARPHPANSTSSPQIRQRILGVLEASDFRRVKPSGAAPAQFLSQRSTHEAAIPETLRCR